MKSNFFPKKFRRMALFYIFANLLNVWHSRRQWILVSAFLVSLLKFVIQLKNVKKSNLTHSGASQMTQWETMHMPKLEMQATQVRSQGGEDSLEKEMATCSSILGWKTLWSEEPGGLQSIRLQRVGHD